MTATILTTRGVNLPAHGLPVAPRKRRKDATKLTEREMYTSSISDKINAPGEKLELRAGHFTTPDEGAMQDKSTTVAPSKEEPRFCLVCSELYCSARGYQKYCSKRCKKTARDRRRRKQPRRIENHRKNIRQYHLRTPERNRARRAARDAVKIGALIKPDCCSVCGVKTKLEGHHHKGYARENWLDVQWLCGQCHDKADGK